MSMQGKSFMIVDDVPQIRDLIGAVIDKGGGSYSEADSEATMIKQLTDGQVPDAILLDINLPEGSSLKSVSKIRALPNTSRVKICFISGEREKSMVTTAIVAGAIDYIMKPLDPATLERKLGSLFSASDDTEKLFHQLPVSLWANFPGQMTMSRGVVVAVSEFDMTIRLDGEVKGGSVLCADIPTYAKEIGYQGAFHLRVIACRKQGAQWMTRCALIGIPEATAMRMRKVLMSGRPLADADVPPPDDGKRKKAGGATKR